MMIVPLLPDEAAPLPQESSKSSASVFGRVLDELGATLRRAQASEDAFAGGSGSLRAAIYDRAQADITVTVAVAAVSRTVQSLQAILQMQI